jgi:hypothetical protein
MKFEQQALIPIAAAGPGPWLGESVGDALRQIDRRSAWNKTSVDQ